MRKFTAVVVLAGQLAASADDADQGSGSTIASTTESTEVADTTGPVATDAPPDTAVPTTGLQAAAASRSLLPTVDGDRDYLAAAPGWLTETDPADLGAFVPEWDQGRVDVGNGEGDSAWVHDDIRATALVLRQGDQTVVMLTADLYMIFLADHDEIERRIREVLPAELADANVVISANHNHHGPDSAFSVNDDWYDMAADQMAGAVADALDAGFRDVTLVAGVGEHRFGQSDQRDPLIVDPRLNVAQVQATDGSAVATLVQWTNHPETTLGWEPPGDYSAECAQKGWAADDCSAEGRYLTADYPGVLRERIQQDVGGEVLYFNGPLGSQIGPGRADVWEIDADHPLGDGVTPPAGAQPVAGAADFRERNLARTAAIGNALADAVEGVLADAATVSVDGIEWGREDYYTRLTNIGFRVLLADGDLGWQTPHAYTCGPKPFTDDTCVDDEGAMADDPVLTPMIESQIRVGDVLKTRLTWVRLGDVGFLFMPGELPPELVLGLPDDFVDNTAAYYENPDLHATGADYEIPGALLDLVPTTQTFTVGLGGDELGYWTPINEVRLKCLDLVIPSDTGYTCQRLFDEGALVAPDAVGGPVCRELMENPQLLTQEDAGQAQRTALHAVCRYGQALGRELGEPEDHYEETNSAGWDMVDDTWEAATRLFG